MRYIATNEDLRMLKARSKHLYCRLELLDKDLNIIDSLEGLTIDGSISIDADADVRHTFSSTIYLKKDEDISMYSTDDWVDKLVHVYIGMRPAGGTIHWYSKGVYAFNTNGFTYNATEHNVSISCVDLVALLDGTLSGTLTGYQTTLTSGLKIKQAIIDTFKLAISSGFIGSIDYVVNYWNRTIPYDIDFSTETSVWSILTQLRDLYYPFEIYFDDTTFVCQEIPTGLDDPDIIESEIFQDLVVSESSDVDYGEIKNCVEVFGASIDYDAYADNASISTKIDDDIVKKQKEYKDAVTESATVTSRIIMQGLAFYGNINNTSRPRIIWSEDNLRKYSDFVKESGGFEENSYSTVLAMDDAWGDNESNTVQIAFTPLLVSDDTLIPLLRNDIISYIDEIVATARINCNNDMSKLPSTIISLDAEGLQKNIYGETIIVKNMIAAVEGMQSTLLFPLMSTTLAAVDVCAIAGWTQAEQKKKFGTISNFSGKSMHELQSQVWEAKDNVTAVYNKICKEKGDEVKSTEIILNMVDLDVTSDCLIAIVTPLAGICKNVKITIKNTLTAATGEDGTQNIETYGPYFLYTPDTDEDGNDVLMDGTEVAWDTMIVIKYSPTYKKFYYRGEQQVHAMVMLVDKQPTEEEIKQAKIKEGCNNLKFISLEENTGSISEANPRFTIDRIGRRNKICSGSEYDPYTTDESAMQCAEYELWKSCRLTDNVTVECLLIPWLDVNQKLSYIPRYIDTNGEALEFLIKKIDISLGEGTMTLTLSRYFPFYPYIVQNKY